MIDLNFLILFFILLYLAECAIWAKEGGWLVTSWHRRFSMQEGPALRLRNPLPLGFAYRFPPKPLAGPKPAAGGNADPKGALSLKEARRRWKRYQPWSRALHAFELGLILVVFFSILLYEVRLGFLIAWLVLGMLFLFFHLFIVQIFWRAHGRLYPGQKGDRIRKTLICLVSPWQSSRATDLLEDRLLDGFHPLTAACLLLSKGDFGILAHRWFLELHYPATVMIPGSIEPWLCPTPEEEEYLLAQWLARSGFDLQKLLAPRPPSGPLDRSYCPRCDIPYNLAVGNCKDCGRPLEPFK